MVPVLLAKGIKNFLDAKLINGAIQPRIHEFFLPQKTKENIETTEYPFIIIRPHKGREEGANQIIVNLVFGVKSEEQTGYIDVFSLMERTRQALLKQRLIDGVFELTLPYEWEFVDEQPYPEWMGQAKTIWNLPAISQEVQGL